MFTQLEGRDVPLQQFPLSHSHCHCLNVMPAEVNQGLGEYSPMLPTDQVQRLLTVIFG